MIKFNAIQRLIGFLLYKVIAIDKRIVISPEGESSGGFNRLICPNLNLTEAVAFCPWAYLLRCPYQVYKGLHVLVFPLS